MAHPDHWGRLHNSCREPVFVQHDVADAEREPDAKPIAGPANRDVQIACIIALLYGDAGAVFQHPPDICLGRRPEELGVDGRHRLARGIPVDWQFCAGLAEARRDRGSRRRQTPRSGRP